MYTLTAKELYDQSNIFKSLRDYDNYAIYITQAANFGYPKAINTIYVDGTYKKQNYAATLAWYLKTAYSSEPNSHSVHFLAYMYEMGLGVRRDYLKAIELYEISIDKGCKHSLYNLADIYEKGLGLGCEIDYDKAAELYIRYYNYDYDNGCLINYILGLYKKIPCITDLKNGFLYEIISTKISSHVLLDFGINYMPSNHTFTYEKYYKAKILYKLAIEKNNIGYIGYIELARLYSRNPKIVFDKVIKMYELAIEKEFYVAYTELAIEYIKKEYYTKAEELYKQAIEKNIQGNFLNDLAILYKKPYFTDKQNEIIAYFNKINRIDKLAELYGFDEYIISLLRDNYQLELENNNIKEDIEKLERQIGLTEEGELFLEIKREWQNKNDL